MVQKRSEDLRIQRTHRLLLSALVDLLSEKSFSDLRVKDICERAGVHRSTFYTHFEDKSHLLLFGIQELMDDLIHSGDDRSYPAFLHSVYRILKYFQRNQQEYTRLLLDPKDALVQRLFHDEFSRALKSYLRDLHPTMPAREIDIISQFFAGGFLSLVTQWLSEFPDRSAKEMAEELAPLTFRIFLLPKPKDKACPHRPVPSVQGDFSCLAVRHFLKLCRLQDTLPISVRCVPPPDGVH